MEEGGRSTWITRSLVSIRRCATIFLLVSLGAPATVGRAADTIAEIQSALEHARPGELSASTAPEAEDTSQPHGGDAPPSDGAGAGGSAVEAPEIDPAQEEYDPAEGVDPDGRIPMVVLPPDIKHPERWRYIPEGRIKPGNIFQRLLVSSFVVPFIFNNGDVGTGFGLGITDIDFRQKRRREFAGISASYTTKGQQRYTVAWRRFLKARDLPEGGVLLEERSFARARGGWRKTLTRRYFGPGMSARAEDESSYLDSQGILDVGVSISLPDEMDNFVVELGLEFESHSLDDGTVQGVPSMRTAFPVRFAFAENWNYGMLEAELRWDKRDSQRNPYRGWVVGTRMRAALIQTDWHTGSVFEIFGSKIIPVPGLFHRGGLGHEEHPPTDVIALGFQANATAGTLPFFLLPKLGGSKTLRGYIDGRWRDRASWTAAAEYRFWVIPRGFPITRSIRVERIGLAAFYELGAVGGDVPAAWSVAPAHSYGVGFRLSLERAALFRLDLGWSPESFNFTAGFGTSF
jgi:hypothetical protein